MNGRVSCKRKVWMMCVFNFFIVNIQESLRDPQSNWLSFRADGQLIFSNRSIHSVTFRHVRPPLVETFVSTETRARNGLTSESRSNYQQMAHFSSSPRPRYRSTSMHFAFHYLFIYLFIYFLLNLGHKSRLDQGSGL